MPFNIFGLHFFVKKLHRKVNFGNMKSYFKIIDNQKPVIQNYFKIVFIRSEKVKTIPLFLWAWITLIEMIVVEELLESLVATSSFSGCPEDKDINGQYGFPTQLNIHIPQGGY